MSRKQAIIVNCDGNGCKKFTEVTNLDEAPNGWYRVQTAKAGRFGPNGFDLCSLDCVSKWARGRKQVEIPESLPTFKMDERTHLLEHVSDDDDNVETNGFNAVVEAKSEKKPKNPPKQNIDQILELFKSDPEAELIGADVIDLLNMNKFEVFKGLSKLLNRKEIVLTGGVKGSRTNPSRYKLADNGARDGN